MLITHEQLKNTNTFECVTHEEEAGRNTAIRTATGEAREIKYALAALTYYSLPLSQSECFVLFHSTASYYTRTTGYSEAQGHRLATAMWISADARSHFD